MNHIGILVHPAIGHVNPMVNLGKEIQKRGDKVTFFGVPDLRELLAQSEMQLWEIGANDFPSGHSASIFKKMGKLSGLQGIKLITRTSKNVCEMLFREAPDAFKRAGIDIVLIDHTFYYGGTIAEYMNIPFITICNALPFHQEAAVPPYFTGWSYANTYMARLRNKSGYKLINFIGRKVWGVVQRQRKEWKLELYQKRSSAYSPLAQISQLPQALDFPREELPGYFHYIGPFKNSSDIEPVFSDSQDFDFDKLNGKPLIYANLGSIQNRNRKIFDCIAQACSELDVDFQLVISLGNRNEDSSQVKFPGSPLVFSFPPHQKLINRAHLVITHAGSTALNCLSVGVPMVAIPITADQPAMAARIARAGAGEVILLKKLNVSTLKASIEKVFVNQEYRDNAKKIGAAIQEAGGVERAVDIIEQVMATGQPVLTK